LCRPSPKGNSQRINYGSKLTVQLGVHDVGVLQVQTGEDDVALGENFAVARIKRRILSQSYVGALYTVRNASGGDLEDRQTIGVDFRLTTSTFRGRQNLQATGYVLHTTNPLDTGKGSAFGAELSYPNDPWSFSTGYMEIQDNYDAAVGYTRRTGFRKIQPRIGFAPRPRQHPWIRRLTFRSDVDWRLDPDTNRTLTREIDVTAFDLFTHNQERVEVHVIPTYELLEEDFKISPNITLPVGRNYSFTRYRVEGRTADHRLVSVRPGVEWGDFYSRDRLQVDVNLNIRPRPGLLFTLANEWNRVELAEGSFYTRLYRFVSETQFSPFISFVNNVQFDSQSAVLGWQSRFRWIVRPGNDVFFVYIHNWQDDPLSSRIYTLDRRATSKISYTHRF
jgi:hypothetical protein